MTLFWIGIFHIFPAQAQEDTLTNPAQEGGDQQNHNLKQHYYIDIFSQTGNMVVPRFEHTATLLLDGTVLMAGGLNIENLGGIWVSFQSRPQSFSM